MCIKLSTTAQFSTFECALSLYLLAKSSGLSSMSPSGVVKSSLWSELKVPQSPYDIRISCDNSDTSSSS